MIQKEFIRSELKYRYPNLSDSILVPDQFVARPLLFEPGEKRFGARIIIATGEEMDNFAGEHQRESLFLCLGSPKEEALRAFDVCVLPKTEQAGAVLNFIQRLFDRLDDWTQSLRQAAETGETVEALLARASGMLQNPVLLLDARGHIIAQSEQTEFPGKYPFVRYDNLQEDAIESGKTEKLGAGSSPDALRSFIRLGETYCALLCLASERPLYASDEIVFDSVAGFLRLMLSQQKFLFSTRRQTPEREARARAFRSLFLQDAPQKESIEALARSGWDETGSYTILAIEPKNGELRATQADAICETMEERIKECCAFTLLPVVVAIVKTTLLEDVALTASLREIAKEGALSIGVCETYEGFSYLKERLTQAKRAIDCADVFSDVARYSDLFEEELLSNALFRFPIELNCLRSVQALASYDRTHDASYQKTVELYVKNRFNAVKTAGELYIHRSTFLYRLERIREQFGLDLDDPNISLLHLTYSLRSVRSK